MSKLEICVDSVEAAMAAELGGADRIELCSGLAEGGLTPSAGLIRAVRAKVRLGVHVMIRPRGGDFLYSEEEFAVMRDDIRLAADFGADGVVLGILTADCDIDVERTRRLVELAGAMETTFHRAFDMSRDLDVALEGIVATGAHRILTSGAANSALEGSERVAGLVRAAAGRVQIMIAGGIRPANVAQIAEVARADAFHTSLRVAVPSPVLHQNLGLSLGSPDVDEYLRYEVRVQDVRSMRSAIDALSEV